MISIIGKMAHNFALEFYEYLPIVTLAATEKL